MNEQTFREWYANSPDVHFFPYTSDLMNLQCLLIYCDGLCDRDLINTLVLPELQLLTHEHLQSHSDNQPLGPLMFSSLKQPWSEEELSLLLFSGNLLLYFPLEQMLFQLDIQRQPQRKPEESNMENTTRGPRDGFIENISTNIALIRKRLQTNDLHFEEFTVGNRNKTKIALLYMKDVKDLVYLTEVKQKLSTLNVDSLISVSQLEELLSDFPFSLFPLMTYSGRPDFAVDCLLHDRFVIVVDGDPAVLIAPANLLLLLKSPEDIFFSYGSTIFGRLLRLIGLWISIFLPGLWISLSQFNQDQLPFLLLATVTVTRLGLPLPAPLEMVLTLLLLELFREASARLPKSIGQSITVVGGLLIGDAAVRAGLISPSIIVIGALTAVASSTLANLNLSGNVVLLRLFIFLISSVLGMFGFMLGVIFIIWYLSQLRSFGVPYLAPMSPITWRDLLSALFKLPAKSANQRPSMLKKSRRKE